MPGMAHWNHPRFFAYFTSSGSAPGILGELLGAALNAIAAAREQIAGVNVREHGLGAAPRLRIYTSEQGHSSIDKAAMALGLGLESVRRVEADDEYRMNESE
jgi:aromatic-L-amino-acid decarboxylase